MYTSIHIRNFRSLDDLTIDGLKRINLFVGKNNAGKTSLLEGIFLLGGATSPNVAMTIGYLRGQRFDASRPEPDPIWRPLFARLDTTKEIEIIARREEEAAERRLSITAPEVSLVEYATPPEEDVARAGEEGPVRELQFRYLDAFGDSITRRASVDPKTGAVSAQRAQRLDFVRSSFVSARSFSSLTRNMDQFGSLLRRKQDHQVLEALRLLDPSIKRLEVVPEAGGSTIYADMGLANLVPLLVCGEGVVRMFSIAVELTAASGGVLLIDEIDNGLHHSVMPNFWTQLRELSRLHDVQIFATTHNDELIRSALTAFGEGYEDLGLYRLDRRDGGVKAVRYSEEALRGVAEAGFEVRG